MAKLVVIEGPDRGLEFVLPEENVPQTVGRDPKNPIVLSDGSVSRQHLRIDFTGRDYRLVDLGSRNRTFLNGEPVREGLLRPGDTIGLGDSELRFEDDRKPIDQPGMNSTIMKEIPATGKAGLEGILSSLSRDGEGRDERIGEALGRVRRLLELSQAIARSGSLDELYSELLAILMPALRADRGAILVREGAGWATRAMRTGTGEVRSGEPLAVSESVVRRAADEEKAVLSASTRQDGRFQDKRSIVDAGIVSAIAAPVVVGRDRPAGEAAGGRPGTAAGKATDTAGERSRVIAVIYADRRGRERPFEEAELGLLTAAALEAGTLAGRLREEARLRDENRNLLRSISESKKIIGRSPANEAVLEFIRRAAPAPQTILIRGETGTGKELVASAIHYGSPRQGNPFVAINCAAIPPTLIESELFGHERGAFTGALSRRKGKFELADGGTVFLDEVAELSPACQAKLLRLLEEKRFERVGGTQQVEVDVRIIAATNKDLARAIESGEFREDLFYRLNVLGVTLPPLRERKEDIPLLANHFLADIGKAKWALDPDAVEKLTAYSWPGNIRQLRNAIESAVVFGDGPVLRAADLNLPVGTGPAGGAAGPFGPGWEPVTLEELQRRHILKVLEYTGGNKKRAADLLGIERCTLYAKLKTICHVTPSRPAGEGEGENGDGGRSEKPKG